MVEREAGRGGLPVNANSLLALVTLASGIWLVSHKLSSHRPVTPAGEAQAFLAEQRLEARLWEDPFKDPGHRNLDPEAQPTRTDLHEFVKQLRERPAARTGQTCWCSGWMTVSLKTSHCCVCHCCWEPLRGPDDLKDANPADVALIGPWRSATLRAMLPGKLTGREPWSGSASNLWPAASNVLRHIAVYCATPSVMDEVLVQTNDEKDSPRYSVQVAITNNGFKSFRNFAATDAQLAEEVLGELALRRADLISTNNHLVLISEWDTFYARMLSLTYAAEIAKLQDPAVSRAGFVEAYRLGHRPWPTNLHSFVYLRGLDGQTVGEESKDRSSAVNEQYSPKMAPSSIEELRQWRPDSNKAEGQAQFDYLSRLGDQLAELDRKLRRDDFRNRIKAVGVVGSDLYDTLLILQALRPRFPNYWFFTTDLDARLWHPRERDWSRNLIVASAYGLSLHPDLQPDTPSFRDSIRTT